MSGRMKFFVDEKVRHPIGAKILGITFILLTLMGIVTYTSNTNLKKLNEELYVLSAYYIPLDQALGDLRMNYTLQILSFERVIASQPRKGIEIARQEGEKLARAMPSCGRDDTKTFRAKARAMFPAADQYNMAVYEMQRRCTDVQIDLTRELSEKALSMPVVAQSPDLIRKFTKLQEQLAQIPKLRTDLHNGIMRYIAELQKGGSQSVGLLMEQFEQNRRTVGIETGNISGLLHSYTQEAAKKANRLERQAFRFNWSMTLAAAIFGLICAVFLTRNLVRPIRNLLTGAQEIQDGNLNIQVQVSSADEIALLAQSFNYMVTGLKEKETIKETFGKYLDPKIVKTLLEGQALIQSGEKRTMTVFFSDIQNFTNMSEQLAPNVVVRLLNHYISMMSEPIRDNHGIIDKYIGDAIMAFWGPPFSGAGEHALLACQAALEQCRRLEQFRQSIPDIVGLRKGMPGFNVRMGICTGEVIAGTVGAEMAKSYTVIGDTVNLASRLEAANKMYGTHLIISGSTFDMAKDHIEARELDIVRVMGKTESVRIFELLGLKGNVPSRSLELCDTFEKGLAFYRSREWKDARESFEACLTIDPDDGPSHLFISRIIPYESDPPGDEWTGIWDLSGK
jgi:adenylate cyclase